MLAFTSGSTHSHVSTSSNSSSSRLPKLAGLRKLLQHAGYGVAALLLAFVAIGTLPQAQAQQTSSITGTVTDNSGAVVPNAQITIRQQETNVNRTTVTNGSGLFNMPGLPVGHYTLEVKAPGFKAYHSAGIVVNAAQTVEANVQLAVGASTQTITVQAAALQLQTQTNQVSRVISGEQVTNIATNGRNITSLITLGAGVSGNLPAFNGVTAQNSVATISFNGMRPDHNNFLVDGGEAYDRGSGGKPDVLPSPDAIGQFQVLSSNYSAGFGYASGGTVLVELKNGTNRFHGGLWEFNRNDALDAHSYFSKLTNTPTPELRLNIFGGNLGGPVWIPNVYNESKNKTFFFVNEEWRRLIQGVNPSITPTVPLDNFPTSSSSPFTYTPWNGGGAPIVPDLPGNAAYTAVERANGLTPGQPFPANPAGGYTIPANMLDPNAVLFMQTGAIPKPNTGTDGFVGAPKQPTYVREDVVRIDQNFGSKYHLMGSWIHDAMVQTLIPTQWSGDSYTTVGDQFANPSWASAIRLTQTISPHVLNETGLYVNGNTIDVSPVGIFKQPAGWSASSFFPDNNALNRLPQVAFNGGPINTTYTSIYWPWHNSYLNYQIRDSLSWLKGKHAFQFGGSYMREDKNQQLQADTQGDYAFSGSQYTGSSYLNFLLGLSQSYSQLQSLNTDHWLSNNYAMFATDNWHVLPRLTLNLGIRYDIMPHTYEKNNRVSNFNPAAYNAANAATFTNSGSICTAAGVGGCSAPSPGLEKVNGGTFYLNGIQLAGVNGVPRGIVQNDYFTVEPRVGFAWDALNNGKSVLRGGIGLFYERVQGNDIYDINTTAPFAYQPAVTNVFFSSPQTSITSGASTTVPVATANLTTLASYYPHPAVAQYSFGIQQQLSPSMIASIGYVGSTGWDQDYRIETNDLALNNMAAREAVATSCSGTWVPVDGVTSCPDPNPNLYRQFVGYGNILQLTNGVNSTYNSLQATLRMSNYHGLTLEGNYTWSHELGIVSNDINTVSNPYNVKYDYGAGQYDRRNIFNINYTYAEPFFLHGNAFKREALGGWMIAGVTTAESGAPTNITYNGPDVLGLGGNTTNRPNVVGTVSFPKTQTQWFTTSAFAAPVAPWNGGGNNGFGDARKDTIIQPGLFNWNLSLYKTFRITSHEGPRIQLRFDSFNTFNHTQFNGIDTGTNNSTFGQVTSAYDPRVLQLGGKFLF